MKLAERAIEAIAVAHFAGLKISNGLTWGLRRRLYAGRPLRGLGVFFFLAFSAVLGGLAVNFSGNGK
jgi:hypothetical protein